VSSPQDYLQRLADIDDAVARAQPEPDVLVERAAGLIAGRVGCRIEEAHAHLRQIASEQDREPAEVAGDVLIALQARLPAGASTVRAAVESVLRRPVRPASRATDQATLVAAEPPADGDAWTATMRQVLNAVAGNHTVVSPVRDGAGQIRDFVVVAVSPTVVDLSGRRDGQVAGRLVSEIYPAVVGGPVWQAWLDTLADRSPREVGPLPYEGGEGDATVAVTLVVRVHAVGPGLLSSWVRPDEQARLSERIAQTERLGNLGWGEWDLLSGNVVWSEEMYRIYQRDPAAGPLRDEEARALRLPEDEPIHQQAAATFGRGETVDMTYRVRIGEHIKHLRTVIDAVRDINGRPIKVYGITQDVTARETSRAKLADIEQQLHRQRMTLEAEHQLAAQLQHIILPIPQAAIELPGLQAAVRYLPAEQASQVGGDWYHAAGVGDGQVLIAVGDVAGHGIRAATTMARLRHALAALSITSTVEPAELLSHLNRLLRADGNDADTATAVIARYHPLDGTLVWAQAGHPPPLRTRRGATTALERPRGPLLGAARDPTYETATTRLAQTDILLLYTDGLIEHRQKTTAEGFAPVIRTLNEADEQVPLTELVGRLRRANAQDDTCILAVRPAPVSGDDR
jgi:serine phosphatase RsbU (regulator of sigma subunit)